MNRKVFCIGFQKTGTTSIGKALRILGHTVSDVREFAGLQDASEIFERAVEVSKRYDAFQDNPWPVFYRQMDSMYPGSKFILTVRDPASWIESVMDQFRGRERAMLNFVYGISKPDGHEDQFVETMLNHNREVQSHFSERPDDLLVLDMEQGFGWPRLCGFLNVPEPDAPFPHLNSRQQMLTKLQKSRRAGIFGYVRGILGRT